MKTTIAAGVSLLLGAWLGFAFGGGLSPAMAQAEPLNDTTSELGRIADALERIESKCCEK